MATITGAKGGSQKQHTPVEQPDSAQSMARCRMLLALGEGEFAGGLDATRIFLDGTPLGNAVAESFFKTLKRELAEERGYGTRGRGQAGHLQAHRALLQ